MTIERSPEPLSVTEAQLKESSRAGVPAPDKLAQNVAGIMDYITIGSTGNATDFGDLSQTRRKLSGLSGSAS